MFKGSLLPVTGLLNIWNWNLFKQRYIKKQNRCAICYHLLLLLLLQSSCTSHRFFYLRHYIANAFLTEVYKIIDSLWSSGSSSKCHNSLYVRQAYFQAEKEALLGQYFLQSWNISSALYSGFFLWSVCLGQKSFDWSRSKKAWAMPLPPELLPPSFPSALWYWKSH